MLLTVDVLGILPHRTDIQRAKHVKSFDFVFWGLDFDRLILQRDRERGKSWELVSAVTQRIQRRTAMEHIMWLRQ